MSIPSCNLFPSLQKADRLGKTAGQFNSIPKLKGDLIRIYQYKEDNYLTEHARLQLGLKINQLSFFINIRHILFHIMEYKSEKKIQFYTFGKYEFTKHPNSWYKIEVRFKKLECKDHGEVAENVQCSQLHEKESLK